MKHIAEADLCRLKKWFDHKYLTINMSETYCMLIFSVPNQYIWRTRSISLSKKLTFLLSRFNRQREILYRKSIEIFYFPLVKSNPVRAWGGIGKILVNKLIISKKKNNEDHLPKVEGIFLFYQDIQLYTKNNSGY